MHPAFDGLGDLSGSSPAVAVQRAVAELRSGRAVLLEWPGSPLLVAAADTMSPALYAAFVAAPSAELALTAERAAAIGLSEGAGAVLLPLAGLEQRRAEALAAARVVEVEGLCAAAATPGVEAALDLCKRAHLLPAALVAPSPGVGPSIQRLSARDLLACGPEDEVSVEIVSSASVPLTAAPARFVVFRSPHSARDQAAVIIGDPNPEQAVPVRLHSACLTGDLFGSLRCDCGDQLRQAMGALEGGGVLLYLDQEGRGTGLRNKLRAYALQDAGLDTIDADGALGYGPDERRYAIAAAMLRTLGFGRVQLLTNNPEKLAALARAGIEVVGHTPLLAPMTPENRRYLVAKAERGGHMLEALFGVEPPLSRSDPAR